MELLARVPRPPRARCGLPPGGCLSPSPGGPTRSPCWTCCAGRGTHMTSSSVVGHVDHGIHPDSGAVAGQVARLAAELGVACHIEAAGLGPDAGETEAREARYRAAVRAGGSPRHRARPHGPPRGRSGRDHPAPRARRARVPRDWREWPRLPAGWSARFCRSVARQLARYVEEQATGRLARPGQPGPGPSAELAPAGAAPAGPRQAPR